MITRFGMAPRRADLTPQQALDHWRTTHADAAGRIPGLRRYVQWHPVLEDGAHLLPYPGYDAGSFLEFDDLAAMEAGFASPTYQRDVRDDEASFIDHAGFSLVVGERVVLRPIEEPVVLLSMWRRHPAATPEQLAIAMTEVVDATLADEERGHERLEPVPHDHDGRWVTACEAVDLVGFAEPGEAVAWLRHGAGRRLDRDLAPAVLGAARLVCRPHVVV